MAFATDTGKLAAVSRAILDVSWRRLLCAATDVLFPPACVNCANGIEAPDDTIQLCPPCRRAFVDPTPPCRFCGADLAEGINPDGRCGRCRGVRFRFSAIVRLGKYEGGLQPAILRAKQSINVAIAIHLGRLLAEVRYEELARLGADAVIAAPAFWTRQGKHGHKSADVLAMEVAHRLRLPIAEHLVVRTRATRPQAELTPPQRRNNVRNAFAVRPHRDLPGAKILLVDDVLTTGSTANEVAKALLKAGAESVDVAVLARTVGGK